MSKKDRTTKPYQVEEIIKQGHHALWRELARGLPHGHPGERKHKGGGR